MALFVAFLALTIAQFTAVSVAEVSCEKCTTRIRDQLKKIPRPLRSLDDFKTNVSKSFFDVHSSITLPSDVCPGSNTSYEVVLKLVEAGFLTRVTGSMSKYRNMFHDFYSALANESTKKCQYGATLQNDNKSDYHIPDLCNEHCLANLPTSKIKGVSLRLSDAIEEVFLANEFNGFLVKFWVDVSGGKTRITKLEYVRDTESSIRNACTLTDMKHYVVKTCDCIANDVFQKPFFETIIPRLLACYANGDAFAPVRNAINCVT